MIALLTALLVSVIAGIVEFSFISYGFERYGLFLVVSLLIIFSAVYLLVFFLLNNFIFEKINPIYKTINNLKPHENNLHKERDKKDVIEDLNREVEDWATNKTQEIDQLKEMERYRSEFLGNVSKELKTPILNVQSYIFSLLDGNIDDPSLNKKYLERAKNSVGRLINIVNDLDTITGLDSGDVNIHFENFDIVALTEEVFDHQLFKAQKEGIELNLKNRNEKPTMVHADRKRIKEVLMNLVVNSITYGHNGGKTVVDFIDLENNILVEVTDNGLGLPNDNMPRIFERFYRVDQSRSRNKGGTGLGLAIVKHIVEAHNQTINVKSVEGEGSTFAFTLRKGVHQTA